MYASKNKVSMLREALHNLQSNTAISSIGPGSVARAMTEVTIDEIGDLYAAMDYNTSMTLVSTASGRALEMMAELFGVERKRLSEFAVENQIAGSFYFYIDSPHTSDIDIPYGTIVSTDASTFIGEEYSYMLTQPTVIPAGRTRAYAQIMPRFNDSVFTAGKNTITQHNLTPLDGIIVKCTNPKVIAPQVGYESDENLRARLIKAVRVSAGGTDEAIRFAGLAVQGVRDIKVRSAAYGLGSIEVLVVPESRQLYNTISNEVNATIRQVSPAGSRLIVKEPVYADLNINATVILDPTTETNPQGTADRSRNAILRYMNILLPGRIMVYTQLIQAIMDASDVIRDVVIQSMTVDGVEIPRRNYQPKDDVQLVPGDQITVSASR